ncbi:diaminopimelate decarboxylase [Barnesiella sp. An22]|uniref:diaminopimelate decarboxylase n=1 Tax=Barnesiella sp. An22 TaxID=1965590 RepID=UPI000B37EC05|nr:diaminopimelate decarboxylase [Barnesiella sp. An22]OUO99413.1 diaminopimelate decarboxylase [Barnesiella sp. An22]HJB73902.1 diaminopimelate decarboxylase [Candidatus Barnesiella merdigallinarum]
MFPITHFNQEKTPFYYYDKTLLNNTLSTLTRLAEERNFQVHYAIKANANPEVLRLIAASGVGADCVSGGEIKAALEAGFPARKIVFAGVGKADWEIEYALDNKIFCFNVESAEELAVIEELARKKETVASIALRLNPNIDAHTHEYITTGLSENKFGIPIEMLDGVLAQLQGYTHVQLIGFHFHIGSQILNMEAFRVLCERINRLQDDLVKRNIQVKHINVGGGLGVDYDNPDKNPIPDFETYFNVFRDTLDLRSGQQLHFELGRAIVCQCGSLITRVLYVKKSLKKQFVIVDAGMTDLIRPALYQAHHHIENITSDMAMQPYDVVGPICESSDCFGKNVMLNATERGDLIAIRSAGAYGEIMASQYNCRPLPGHLIE